MKFLNHIQFSAHP